MATLSQVKAEIRRVKKSVFAAYPEPAPPPVTPEPEGCPMEGVVEDLQMRLHGALRRIAALERAQARAARPSDEEMLTRLAAEPMVQTRIEL